MRAYATGDNGKIRPIVRSVHFAAESRCSGEAVKILVPLKQVADPDHYARIRLSADATEIDDRGLERKPNPFDEYALETALRLCEDGRNPRQRLGEVVAITLGPQSADSVLRSAMATGADRALRVNCTDEQIDGRIVAKVIADIARKESVDLIVLGKQTVDGDSNEVAQRVGALLDYPQACFCAAILEQPDGALHVEQEFDGGVRRLALTLPAVVSVDLRIVSPNSVRSHHTPTSHAYPPGVRFASLPSIMQSKRKPLTVIELAHCITDCSLALEYRQFRLPKPRGESRRVTTATELVELLSTEAKVL